MNGVKPQQSKAQQSALDRALVIGARDGDPACHSELGRRSAQYCYRFALQLTADPELAKDVAQESVARFFDHIDRFDSNQPIERWLYQIVRNRVRDLARRDRARSKSGATSESLDALIETRQLPTSDASTNPAVALEQTDFQRHLWNAVASLTEDQREIFVLRDFHGLSYREIAETLSIPTGTVMSRLHTARMRLRTLLRPPEDEGETPIHPNRKES